MPFENRGGFPIVRRITAPATAAGWHQTTSAILKWIRLRNTEAGGGNTVRIYFNPDAFADDANYVELAPGEIFREPVEIREIWFRGVTGSVVVEMVEFNRRG